MSRDLIWIPLWAFAAIADAPAQEAARAVGGGSTVTVVVEHAGAPVDGAAVRLGRFTARGDAAGRAVLPGVPAGAHRLEVARIGFAPYAGSLTIAEGRDTTVTVELEPAPAQLEGIVVTTRTERRVEDEPLRVEVLNAEEVEEKVRMTPGDISMMLNETSGLRVVVTSPSLGGANLRVQGLRGRYTQILADGLPLYGGQTGGLGMLQIPPLDLGGVEVLKGVSSALYGGAALGGVVNLLSRRPGEGPARELLVNQTSRGGTDLVGFLAGPAGPRWGYTVLAGAHRDSRNDVDRDGWADSPGYRRGVVRPRLFRRGDGGGTLMVTAGATVERREGGTMPGRLAPDGAPYPERQATSRVDAGFVGRWPLRGFAIAARGSGAVQDHRHTFGATVERDRHVSWFGEVASTFVRPQWGAVVVGAAVAQERYHARDVGGFDYTYTTPGLFGQWSAEVHPGAVTVSGRVDRHSRYGTQWTSRLATLQRLGRGWSLRAAYGTGYFAPTPFTEETEAVGLARVVPLVVDRVERGRGASVDLNGRFRAVELNATVFMAQVSAALDVEPVAPADSTMIRLAQREGVRSEGVELLARWSAEPVRVTVTYTYTVAREGGRDEVPLTPRHAAGAVVAHESERARIGVELYYVGVQRLEADPFRSESKPYAHLGLLVERRFGRLALWLNGENLFGFRQTRYAPLVRPAPGLGGRWTVDAWGPLEGRVANVGVRVTRASP